MRKVFILTGFLLVLAMACLIGAEKPGLLKSSVHQGNLKTSRVPGSTNYRGFFQSEKGNHSIVKKRNDQEMSSGTERQYMAEYMELSEEAGRLERVCAECRLILDKAGIEDSVYDQYDNPEGRLHRYKVEIMLKKLFNTSKALNANRMQKEKLKRLYNGK